MSMLPCKLKLKCDRAKSKVKQADAKMCDINNIIKTYTKTGKLPDIVQRTFKYGDYASVIDYQSSMEIIARSNEQFMSLPSELRNRFKNDPALMLDFLNDRNNLDEAIALGLCKKAVGEPVKEELAKKPDSDPNSGGVK